MDRTQHVEKEGSGRACGRMFCPAVVTFCFFLAPKKGDKDGTVEKRKQFIVVWHTLPMMLCSSARAGTTGLLDASVPCANGGFCGIYFREGTELCIFCVT